MNLFKKAGCRIVQCTLALGKYLIRWRQPKRAVGPGSSSRIALVVRKRGVRRLLILSGSHTPKLGLLDPLCEGLQAEGVAYTLYAGVKADPTTENVRQALEVYRANGCDGLLAFGGGSPMDCAKAVGALLARPDRTLPEMAGLFRVGRRLPPFFAIPTTAGTGSETTMAAVITEESTHRKFAINDPHLVPDYAALDPALTVGLPPQITAATGMDALTHAVEAYTNRFGGPTRRPALEAVQKIFRSLPAAYADGADLAARDEMLRASYLAGTAFTRAGVGYVHAVAHTVGGLYGVPHGLANAVLLPVVLERYGDSATRPLARLADAVGLGGGTPEEKARAFIAAVRAMNDRMGIPRGFDCIRQEDIPTMTAWALAEANPLYPCPRVFGETDLRAVIEAARLPEIRA